MFYVGKIIFLISTKFILFNLILWFSEWNMEMNVMEKHCKRKKNRKGNEDTHTVHDMHENMYVYVHIACIW